MTIQSSFERAFSKADVLLCNGIGFDASYIIPCSKQRPSTGQISFFRQLHVLSAVVWFVSLLL